MKVRFAAAVAAPLLLLGCGNGEQQSVQASAGQSDEEVVMPVLEGTPSGFTVTAPPTGMGSIFGEAQTTAVRLPGSTEEAGSGVSNPDGTPLTDAQVEEITATAASDPVAGFVDILGPDALASEALADPSIDAMGVLSGDAALPMVRISLLPAGLHNRPSELIPEPARVLESEAASATTQGLMRQPVGDGGWVLEALFRNVPAGEVANALLSVDIS